MARQLRYVLVLTVDGLLVCFLTDYTGTHVDLSLLPDSMYMYRTLDFRRGVFQTDDVLMHALTSLGQELMDEANKKFVKLLIVANGRVGVLVEENKERIERN